MRFVIDRTNKKLQVASSRTNYKLFTRPWKELFDRGKEKIQEEATDKMDDVEFKDCIIRDMKTCGYLLKKGM